MDYSANIPRGKISTTREFRVPFRTRSSSHSSQCNHADPDTTCTFSSPSMASRPKPNSTDSYFSSISEIKTDDERSSGENETSQKDRQDANLSSSPTATDTENDAGHAQGASTSSYARLVAYGLIGMTVSDTGDIIDNAKKTCGKASGDICEMVGQRIGEDGLVRSKAGEVVGQVAHNYGLEEAVSAILEAQKKSSGGSESSKKNTTHTEEKARDGKSAGQEKSQELPNIWQGTVGEGAPGNDIHLNVQSTKEGISMSIRIPTLFMKEQHRQFEEKNAADQPSK